MIEYLTFKKRLPPHLKIGGDCKRHHGFNGKAVRYKAGGNCIQCVLERKG